MNYIHLPGDPQARPPYLGRGVLMHGGFVRCDAAQLEILCDRTLNHVDPDLGFRVVGDRVLYAALYADRMSSAHPEDSRFGSVPEIDIGLWVLVWGGRRGELPQLRWMPAFIFVDSPSALMTGRELYGYPKQFGHMTRRGVADEDFSVSLRSVCFLQEDSNEQAKPHEVLRVERAANAAPAMVEIKDGLSLLSGFRDLVGEEGAWGQSISRLTPPFIGMPMVFLRQMRDVTVVDGATVQEIAAVTVAPTVIAGGGLAGDHRLVLPEVASFPIAATLGCASTSDLALPFWVRFDFQVGVGQRL